MTGIWCFDSEPWKVDETNTARDVCDFTSEMLWKTLDYYNIILLLIGMNSQSYRTLKHPKLWAIRTAQSSSEINTRNRILRVRTFRENPIGTIIFYYKYHHKWNVLNINSHILEYYFYFLFFQCELYRKKQNMFLFGFKVRKFKTVKKFEKNKARLRVW